MLRGIDHPKKYTSTYMYNIGKKFEMCPSTSILALLFGTK